MPEININENLRQRLGSFANRDESWDDALERVLTHVDEEAAMSDRDDRDIAHSDGCGCGSSGVSSGLDRLNDGTELRHEYKRGSHAGGQTEAQVQNGEIVYDGNVMSSPSRAAVEADKAFRGDSAPDENNGWKFWEYYDEGRDEWRPIDILRD